VGVVKRLVLRGLWRRLVGVGIIGPGLLGAPAFILSLAALIRVPQPPWRGLRFASLKRCAVSPVCDNTYPRWGGHDTLVRMCTTPLCSAHRLLSYGRSSHARGSDPLWQIETSVTLCGMVWVRAKVLGQMGWTTSPYQRACALSCPSLAIYGPGGSL
jgi:hypothetical protein